MLFVIDDIPSFRIHFYKTSIADKWQSLVEESYVGDGKDIDSRRSFYHLQNKTDVKNDLLKAIERINSFVKFNFINLPKQINWDDGNFYNELHVCFERLSGEFDNPTKLFKIAPEHVKESIRDLNYCVHTLEHDNINNNKTELKIQWTKTREQTKRTKFEEHEYDNFQFTKKKNEVYLAYNELGKNYVDLWKDNLPKNYSNLKNNHYVGKDIMISLEDADTIFENEFIEWMNANNIDPYDKTLGIGLAPIGKCEIINTSHLTKDSKVDIITEKEKT